MDSDPDPVRPFLFLLAAFFRALRFLFDASAGPVGVE